MMMMIRAFAFIALLAVAAQGADTAGLQQVKAVNKVISAAMHREEFIQAINAASKNAQDVRGRALAEQTANSSDATCTSLVNTLLTNDANAAENAVVASLQRDDKAVVVLVQGVLECGVKDTTSCASSTNCTMITDENDATKKECGVKPELYAPRLRAAGVDATTVMYFEISSQSTLCNLLGNVEATCNANKKCMYDDDSKKCDVSPKWTVVTLANGCPGQAGKIEQFANTGGFTLSALAAEQGVTLDPTAAANAAAVSSAAAPRAAAASLLLASIIAASAFLVM